MNDAAGAPAVFVIDDDPAVLAAIRGLQAESLAQLVK